MPFGTFLKLSLLQAMISGFHGVPPLSLPICLSPLDRLPKRLSVSSLPVCLSPLDGLPKRLSVSSKFTTAIAPCRSLSPEGCLSHAQVSVPLDCTGTNLHLNVPEALGTQ